MEGKTKKLPNKTKKRKMETMKIKEGRIHVAVKMAPISRYL